MRKTTGYLAILVLLSIASAATVQAHCQVPCGIYDDQVRIQLMNEHVATIEKAMNKIESEPSQNQIVRWVMAKDKHADDLSEIVTYYFMAQRIKPGCEDYALKIGQLHEMLVYSMKAKQTTDLANVEKLKGLIDQFGHSYMGEKHEH